MPHSLQKLTDKAPYNAYMREYRLKNRDKIRAYTRAYNNEWRRKHGYAAEIRAKKKFPEKEAARVLLNRAVKSGRIARGACERCGMPRAQAHHDDYMKPLDVRWLCPRHHYAEHHQQLAA
ncbi:MAG TPA: hypothetical protein VM715_20100 [Candidatus Acidoferrum sp.]|nr:hypothetical protein [Candidatus Acidoferrum sp.]